MPANDLMHLNHARNAIVTALNFVQDRSPEDIEKDEMLAFALIRALEMIGEAANYISVDMRTEYPNIPWQEMIATRNRLIHGYFDIRLKVVWDTVVEDLPALEKQLAEIIRIEGEKT